MFTTTNPDFGCTTQPISVFTGTNIDFGFTTQPNCPFTGTNIDFGCAAMRSLPIPTQERGRSIALSRLHARNYGVSP